MAITSNPLFVLPAWKDTRIRWTGIDFATLTFNSNSTSFGTYFAYILQAEKTADLTRVAYRQISRAGTGTKTARLGIMNVSTTTGKPDGTWRGYKDFTVGTETNAMVAQTMDTFSSGSAVSVTRGDVIAIVLEPRSGFSATETLTYTARFGQESFASQLNEFPYTDVSGTKNNGLAVGAYGTSTEWYGYPYGALGEYTHTTQEVGARIKFTNSALSKVALRGIRIYTKRNNAWGMDVKVYDSVSATTPITNGTYTHDFDQGWADYTTFAKPMQIIFPTSPELNTGQYYYVVLSRGSGSNDQVRQRIEMGTGNSGYLDAINQNWECCWTERSTVGSGSFTSTDTMRPDWDFLFDGFEAAGGGGGLLVHPGTNGRING